MGKQCDPDTDPFHNSISGIPVKRKIQTGSSSAPVPVVSPGAVSRAGAGRIGTFVILLCIAALALAPPAVAMPADLNRSTFSPGDIHPGSAEMGSSSTMPAIAFNASPGTLSRVYRFAFEQENITLLTDVRASTYYGARNGDKFATVPAEAQPEALAADYYRAFVDDPSQEQVYADLLDGFHAIRQQYRYSDDEYLELLTVFVQSIPYDNASAAHPDTVARFPGETIVDGTGDCDDKSILLAGLLSREGYNVSLLLFIPEHHMAVGVDSDCLRYRDTGYTYVETTGVSFIGDVPKRLNQSEKYLADGQVPGTVPLASTPIVIRVGSGSKRFSSAGETAYILAQKNAIDARLASLKAEIDRSSGEDPSRLRALLGRYNTYAEIHNFIVQHRSDRAGTYRHLSSILPPPGPGFSSCPIGPSVTPASPFSPATPYRSAEEDTPPATLPDDTNLSLHIPCPRGIWVSQSCLWQSVRQELYPG